MTLRRIVRNQVAKNVPGERPLINLDDVASGAGRICDGTELNSSRAEQNIAAEPGDVLFAKLRPYLRKSVHVVEPVFASSEFLCLRPLAGVVDSRWLFYMSMSDPWVDHSQATSYGAKMPRTSWDEMASLRITPPHLTTQRVIADFLDDQVSRIDEAVRLRREQMAALERRLGLRADALVDEARRSAGWVRLKYRAALVTVGIVVTPSAWYADHGVPALRGTNVKPEAISLEDLVFLTEAGHRLHRKSQLHTGDVVVVRTGQAGAAAVVPEALNGINAIDILIVRPGRDLSPEFLAMCLNAPVTRDLTNATVVGALQGHFNVGTLRDVLVPDVDRTTQDRMAGAWIEQRDAGRMAVSEMADQVALLDQRRRSLITAAVTGEFDVTTAYGRGIQ